MRGLGRYVEPDSHMLTPRVQESARAEVCSDDRKVCVSWVRSGWQGLHSVNVEYAQDAVRLSLKLGTRPSCESHSGSVPLRMVCEHTTVRLREPLRGRRLELVSPIR
ncbi:MAG TPA: hypothetical protein VFA70_03730 [Dehalococcoidia bacterium]|nr:hypothetical protein [Dehalococcoidia bacterium]